MKNKNKTSVTCLWVVARVSSHFECAHLQMIRSRDTISTEISISRKNMMKYYFNVRLCTEESEFSGGIYFLGVIELPADSGQGHPEPKPTLTTLRPAVNSLAWEGHGLTKMHAVARITVPRQVFPYFSIRIALIFDAENWLSTCLWNWKELRRSPQGVYSDYRLVTS